MRALFKRLRTWWRIKFKIDAPAAAWHERIDRVPAVARPFSREEQIDVMNQALGARPTTGVRLTWAERTGIPGFKLDRDRYS